MADEEYEEYPQDFKVSILLAVSHAFIAAVQQVFFVSVNFFVLKILLLLEKCFLHPSSPACQRENVAQS